MSLRYLFNLSHSLRVHSFMFPCILILFLLHFFLPQKKLHTSKCCEFRIHLLDCEITVLLKWLRADRAVITLALFFLFGNFMHRLAGRNTATLSDKHEYFVDTLLKIQIFKI